MRTHSGEVWAMLTLCDEDRERLAEFFSARFGIGRRKLVGNTHLTVYHARRAMPGVVNYSEPASIRIPAAETRFMVMAPGGENPRPNLEPAQRKVGVRIQRQSTVRSSILAYRERLLRYETTSVLGGRQPSTLRTSAFGARSYQPHLVFLRAGSGVPRDLTQVGQAFRSEFDSILLDRFTIRVREL